MSRSWLRLALPCIALAAAAPASWALPLQYHLDDLGHAVEGQHVNAIGQIAAIDASSGTNQALRWTAGAGVDLVDPYTTAYAYGINSAGAVVGNIGTTGFFHAALWTSPGTVVDVGAAFGTPYSSATAINDNGDCTVDASLADGWHAYLVPGCAPAAAIDLGSLGAGGTITTGMNLNQQVAGDSNINSSNTGNRAFLWSAGTMKNLGLLPGGVSSDARGLNGKGHVVGRSVDAKRHAKAYFHNGKTMTDLGTLGGKQSDAYAVNYFDVVVGTAQTAARTWHPFVFDKGSAGTTMHDLQAMLDASGAGWQINRAVSINNAGQILVIGAMAGDIAERSALLTPLP